MTSNLFGISGYKNSGKTTLTAKLITHLTKSGLCVSSIKHAHHSFDLDQPGTDSDKHRQAGAREVLITGQSRWALLHENEKSDVEPTLPDLVAKMTASDIILIEGFKNEAHPKVLLVAQPEEAILLAKIDNIVAIAAETFIDIKSPLPRFDRNDIPAIAMFIANHLKLDEAFEK